MIGYSVCLISLCTITIISLDRFLVLHHHMTYATLVSTLRVRYTLGMIWLTSFFLSSFFFLNASAYFFMVAGITVICIITSSFAYILIYRIVRRHQSQIHSQQQAVGTSISGNSINVIHLKRSAMNTFVFLHIFDRMLYSNVHHVNSYLIKEGHLDKRMELFRNLGIHELVHKSIFILLASTRTSRQS